MTALLSALGTVAWLAMPVLAGWCVVQAVRWASPSDPGSEDDGGE